MKILKTKFENIFVIKHKKNSDQRGYFMRSFCKNNLKKKKIKFDIKQTNFSFNKSKYTLRGFHFQKKPHQEDKLIYCLKGEVLLVILNINKRSKNYLKHFKIRISERVNKSILISKDYATAFLTLKKNTLIFYYMSNFYKKNKSIGIRYNDPKLKIKWPHLPKVISKKDAKLKDLT